MQKRIPLYPRNDLAKKAAKAFLLKSKISTLPVNPFALCNQHGFVIRSVSETEDLIDEIDPFDVRDNPDCDAKTYLTSAGRYIIIYDDAVMSQGRIIWTIAHEIGHIVLKHLEQFEQTEIHNGLTAVENKVLEKEADAFASEFLAPAEVLLHCHCVKKNSIIKLCGLSEEAATYKEQFLKDYKPDEKYSDINQSILRQFYNFINEKDFFQNLHYKICPVCKNYIFSSKEHFCRICGHSISEHSFTKGIAYNDGPEIGKQKRTSVCPKCHFTQDTKAGSSCSNCGASLVNQCSNTLCGMIHIGSSRHCFKCGSPTTFLLEGIISDWKSAQKTYYDRHLIRNILSNDNETGKIMDDWQYFLSLLFNDGEHTLVSSLKQSFAKIDYDTLYLYLPNFEIKEWLKNNDSVLNFLMKSIKKKLKIHILEILFLDVDLKGTVKVEL